MAEVTGSSLDAAAMAESSEQVKTREEFRVAADFGGGRTITVVDSDLLPDAGTARHEAELYRQGAVYQNARAQVRTVTETPWEDVADE